MATSTSLKRHLILLSAFAGLGVLALYWPLLHNGTHVPVLPHYAFYAEMGADDLAYVVLDIPTAAERAERARSGPLGAEAALVARQKCIRKR